MADETETTPTGNPIKPETAKQKAESALVAQVRHTWHRNTSGEAKATYYDASGIAGWSEADAALFARRSALIEELQELTDQVVASIGALASKTAIGPEGHEVPLLPSGYAVIQGFKWGNPSFTMKPRQAVTRRGKKAAVRFSTLKTEAPAKDAPVKVEAAKKAKK